MKKIIATALSLLMSFSLFACSKDTQTSVKDENNNNNNTMNTNLNNSRIDHTNTNTNNNIISQQTSPSSIHPTNSTIKSNEILYHKYIGITKPPLSKNKWIY